MPILDARGRLFGRVNLVDACVLVAGLALLPLGVATWRVFSVRPPQILKIDPEIVRTDGNHRLRVEGRDLRPYLHAFVARAGQPPAFVDLPTNPNEAAFLVEQPALAELKIPDLPPGAYDLYLYDEGREVAHRLSALTVLSPGDRPPGAPDTAMVETVMRFDVSDDVAALMKVGDVDISAKATWMLRPLVLMSLRRVAEPDQPVGFLFNKEGVVTAGVAPPRVRVEATLRAGAVMEFGVWAYDGRRRLRAGENFVLATSAYVASGLITRVALVPGVSAEDASRAAARP
jgi:hypothetical protein